MKKETGELTSTSFLYLPWQAVMQLSGSPDLLITIPSCLFSSGGLTSSAANIASAIKLPISVLFSRLFMSYPPCDVIHSLN